MAGDPRISLAGKVSCFGKSLEQRFHHVVWFAAVEQLQMQVAPRFVGKCLKKLLRQPEPKGRRHVLVSLRGTNLLWGQIIQSAPDQIRPAAEIDDASRQAFIHRQVGFAREGISRIETRAVAANPFLVAQRLQKRLS